MSEPHMFHLEMRDAGGNLIGARKVRLFEEDLLAFMYGARWASVELARDAMASIGLYEKFKELMKIPSYSNRIPLEGKHAVSAGPER